jgi:hypothetical protein
MKHVLSGDSWHEDPGARHTVTRNASKYKPRTGAARYEIRSAAHGKYRDLRRAGTGQQDGARDHRTGPRSRERIIVPAFAARLLLGRPGRAARDFLRGQGIHESEIDKVWLAVALHTTPGIPEHMHPEIALVQAGTGMDMAGRNFDQFTPEVRAAVLEACPRGRDFGHRVIDASYEGLKHRPDTSFGTFNDDFLAFRDPGFQRGNMCSIILGSAWERCPAGHAHD